MTVSVLQQKGRPLRQVRLLDLSARFASLARAEYPLEVDRYHT